MIQYFLKGSLILLTLGLLALSRAQAQSELQPFFVVSGLLLNETYDYNVKTEVSYDCYAQPNKSCHGLEPFTPLSGNTANGFFIGIYGKYYAIATLTLRKGDKIVYQARIVQANDYSQPQVQVEKLAAPIVHEAYNYGLGYGHIYLASVPNSAK